jgi:hypothetical protein
LAERLSVVALVPLSLWFVASIISHAAFIRSLMPLAASFMILLLLAHFHHSVLGLQVAIENYVHSNAKFAAVIAVRLGCWPGLSPPCASHLTAEQCGSSDHAIGRGDQACQGKTVITSSRPRTFSGIDDSSIIAMDGAGRQVCLIDVRRPEDVHHPLSCGEKVVGNDPPMAAPPDRFRAHDRASVSCVPSNRHLVRALYLVGSPGDRQVRRYAHNRSAKVPALQEGLAD